MEVIGDRLLMQSRAKKNYSLPLLGPKAFVVSGDLKRAVGARVEDSFV